MNDLIFHDEDFFFEIIQTTPDLIEATDLLRRARAFAIKEKNKSVKDKNSPDEHAFARLLTRLNDEIKYLNVIQDQISWRNAIKAVYGVEGYNKVSAWMAAGREQSRLKRAG